MMKVTYLLFSILAIACLSPRLISAQGLTIAPAHVVSDYNLGDKTDHLLGQKMKRVLTSSGLSSESELSRFALVPHITIVDEHTSATVPPKTTMQLSVSFDVTDMQTGNVFNSYEITVQGKGTNKANAIHHSVTALSLDTPEFKSFIGRSRSRINDFYESQVDNLVALARTHAKQGEYGLALYLLSEVPGSIASYGKVISAIEECYDLYIEVRAPQLLRQAEATWATSPNATGARKAMELLQEIPAGYKKYDKQVSAFIDKVAKKAIADDNRTWDFLEREAERRHLERISTLEAARDVAVAYALNQPQPINNIILW